MRKWSLWGAAAAAVAMSACGLGSEANTIGQAVSGAVYTTFDETLDGCMPGSSNGVNCNHYVCQDRVYVTGGPNRTNGGNTLENGTYYFAIIEPGSQNGGAADGADGNLSSLFDTVADRTFTMTNGVLSYSGPHPLGTSPNGQTIIGAAPFGVTSNPGGVYILAICPVGSARPADCKFDAFKTEICEDAGVPDGGVKKCDGGKEPPATPGV